MKKHNNHIFVESDMTHTEYDVSDGYIKGYAQDENKRIKLPHKNYTLLAIADECINAPYAEELSKDIVEKNEFGEYLDYELKDNSYTSASDSFQTLARVLNIKPTDLILRDDK